MTQPTPLRLIYKQSARDQQVLMRQALKEMFLRASRNVYKQMPQCVYAITRVTPYGGMDAETQLILQ